MNTYLHCCEYLEKRALVTLITTVAVIVFSLSVQHKCNLCVMFLKNTVYFSILSKGVHLLVLIRVTTRDFFRGGENLSEKTCKMT